MNYLTNEQYQTIIYKKEGKEIYNMSSISYIKHLCEKHLFTYFGYLKACKKIFDYQYKIPLYLSDMLQLIPTKSYRAYDVIWINYANMRRYEAIKTGVRIIFYDGLEIYIDISYLTFKKQIMRLNEIKAYKVKHFH